MDLATPRASRLPFALAAVGLALLLLCVLATAADARERTSHATTTVERWKSPKTYTEPYAYVNVFHEGRRLDRTPLTRCKGQYSDRAITVRISTCGKRWNLRAVYVSFRNKRERFRINYVPKDHPGRANFRTPLTAPGA